MRSGNIKPPSQVTLLKQFDKVEATWQTFRKIQCALAYDEYFEGDMAPMVSQNCKIELMRHRMHELENIYDFLH